ncbi:hypothetical protein ACOME3_000125 [Neoechinorhynchus agilis]
MSLGFTPGSENSQPFNFRFSWLGEYLQGNRVLGSTLIPIAFVGTHLSGETIRIAVPLKLLVTDVSIPSLPIGATVEPPGRHSLACRESGGSYSRHAEVNAILRRALNTGQCVQRPRAE